MFDLWDDGKIKLPSEFWNASAGDKIVLKAFHDKKIERKNKERSEMKRNKTPVFPTIVV
jgi:hypothetical protein